MASSLWQKAPPSATLQVFWGLGVAGSLYLIATQDAALPTFVIDNPWAVWLVGPLFASLAGVTFKEVCLAVLSCLSRL